MLHLARKAFHPGQAAVPAAARRHDLEVPRDVRVPRPRSRASSGIELIVHVNQEGAARGHQPVHARLGSAHRRDEDRGAQAGARQARLRRRLRRRAPRRGEVARQGARLLVPRRRSTAGIRRTSAPSCGSSTTRRKRTGERIRVFPLSNWTELDVWQYIHAGEHPDRAALLRRRAAGGRARRHADHGRRRAHAARARRGAGRCDGALPHARLLPADRRGRERRRHARRDHRGDAARRARPSARAA